MDAQTYKKWQQSHPNIMTPEIKAYEILPNGYIVELSEGTGFEHEGYYGVTLLAYEGDTIATCVGEDRNRSGTVYSAMLNYYNELITIVKAWK
jgi:hypothetical protein